MVILPSHLLLTVWNPVGDCQQSDLLFDFDRLLELKFLGIQVTTDAGLLAFRELNEAPGLTEMGAEVLADSRQGGNNLQQVMPLLRQSIYCRLFITCPLEPRGSSSGCHREAPREASATPG